MGLQAYISGFPGITFGEVRDALRALRRAPPAARKAARGDRRRRAEAAIDRAVEFWTAITEHIPEWGEIRDGHLKPSEARAEFVHCHAVGFWAPATAGRR